jgi:hypothetical protein
MGAEKGGGPLMQALIVAARFPPAGLLKRKSATGAEADSATGKAPEADTLVYAEAPQSPVTSLHEGPRASPSLRPLAPR